MKFRSFAAGLTALCILAGFQSCKPIRSEQVNSEGKEQEELTNQAVLGLKIDFFKKEEGGVLPDFSHPASPHLMEEVMRDGQVIQLKRRLSPNQLFLAISESLGDRRITNAFYEYHSISPSNAIQGNRPPERLNYDQNQHQFYLAMDQLKEQSGEPLSSLDLQVLDLSLDFNDGTDSHLEFRFYVTGDLPSLEQVRVSQVFNEPKFFQAANAPKLSAQSIASQEGWTVLTERYKNPLSRPLTLWFTAKGVSFQLKTQLGIKGNPGDLVLMRPDIAGFEIGPRQDSVATLDQVKLVIKEPRKVGAQTLSLREDARSPVVIGPGQTLEIEWHVSASDKVPHCKDGAPASWTYHACADPEQKVMILFKAIENPDCTPMAPGYVTPHFQWHGTWVVRSYQVSGQFNNTALLTEVIGDSEKLLPKAQKEGFAVKAPVESAISRLEVVVGDTPGSPYSCQGIF